MFRFLIKKKLQTMASTHYRQNKASRAPAVPEGYFFPDYRRYVGVFVGRGLLRAGIAAPEDALQCPDFLPPVYQRTAFCRSFFKKNRRGRGKKISLPSKKKCYFLAIS